MREHDEAVSQEHWPWLEAVNMIEMLSYLGTSELSEQHVTREIEWVITGVEDNTFNGVVRAQLSEANVDRVIDEVAQRFQKRHVWHLWFLAPDSRPADLAHRLEALGWSRLREGVEMPIDLSTLTEPFPPPPGLTVERVVDEAGLALWGTFHRYLENHSRDEPRERLCSSLGLAGEQPLRHYIARLDGELAGDLERCAGPGAAPSVGQLSFYHIPCRSRCSLLTPFDARAVNSCGLLVRSNIQSRAKYAPLVRKNRDAVMKFHSQGLETN